MNWRDQEMGGVEGGEWLGGAMGWFWYLKKKPMSDTQSTAHALAQSIVVWNLRNAFDQSVCVSVAVN